MDWEAFKKKLTKARKDKLVHGASAGAMTSHLVYHNEIERDKAAAEKAALEPAITQDEIEEQAVRRFPKKGTPFRRAIHERVDGPFYKVGSNNTVIAFTRHTYLHATKGWRSRTAPV